MSYRICLESTAERDLERLPKDALRRVDAVFSALAENPRPRGIVKLQGRLGDGWRVRVGEYWMLYTIDDEARVVSVFRIKPRQSAYR